MFKKLVDKTKKNNNNDNNDNNKKKTGVLICFPHLESGEQVLWMQTKGTVMSFFPSVCCIHKLIIGLVNYEKCRFVSC